MGVAIVWLPLRTFTSVSSKVSECDRVSVLVPTML
jgi:hypothetical protein